METTLTQLAALARPAEGLRSEDFERLVREHQRRIYRVLLALTRDPDAAETLTQETFLRAYQKRATFRGEASVGTWLVRTAVHLASDHRKNRRRGFWSRLFGTNERTRETHLPPIELPAAGASPERALAARQELQQVWQAVDLLSPRQRTIFQLRFVEEMTLDEIAQVMQLEIGTVKAHLHRAVSAVRRRLKEKAVR